MLITLGFSLALLPADLRSEAKLSSLNKRATVFANWAYRMGRRHILEKVNSKKDQRIITVVIAAVDIYQRLIF